MKKLLSIFAVLGLSISALTACSTSDSASSVITISDPVVRANDEMSFQNPATGKYMTGSFMTLANASDEDISLIGGSSDAAGIIEIHEVINGEMLPMTDGLVVPANGDVKLRMGGYHVMLMELNNELKAGDEVTVTLKFSDGNTVDYTAPVKMIAMDDEVYGAEMMP
jgi:copper(I)-binding protein